MESVSVGKPPRKHVRVESRWRQGLFFHGDIWEEVWCPPVWDNQNEGYLDMEGYASSLEIPCSSIILWIGNQIISFFPLSLPAGITNTFYSHRLMKNRLVSGSYLLKLHLYLLIEVIQCMSHLILILLQFKSSEQGFQSTLNKLT